MSNEEFKDVEYWLYSENREAVDWRDTATVWELMDSLEALEKKRSQKFFDIPVPRPEKRDPFDPLEKWFPLQKPNKYFDIPQLPKKEGV